MKSFHRRTSRPATAPKPDVAVPRERGARMRVDTLLVDYGLAPSRTAAQRMIAAGRVSWEGGVITKTSLELPDSVHLEVTEDEVDRYVSRGALKLAGAVTASGVTVQDAVCLDVGQSTGGFTDYLLQAGAARVMGLEVGHGQLHERLRADQRVYCVEGINCRELQPEDLGRHLPENGFDLIVADLSFISLTLVLPQLPALLAEGGNMLLLVKPQFEVGPSGLTRGGIVRDPALHTEVENKIRDCCAELGLKVCGWFDSAITGGDGNREFFIWIQR